MSIVGSYSEPSVVLKGGETKTALQVAAPAHKGITIRAIRAQFPSFPGVPEKVVLGHVTLSVETQTGGALANMGLPARRVSGVDRPGEPLLTVYRSVVREEPETVKVLIEHEADIRTGTVIGDDIKGLPLTVGPGEVVGFKFTSPDDLVIRAVEVEHEE